MNREKLRLYCRKRQERSRNNETNADTRRELSEGTSRLLELKRKGLVKKYRATKRSLQRMQKKPDNGPEEKLDAQFECVLQPFFFDSRCYLTKFPTYLQDMLSELLAFIFRHYLILVFLQLTTIGKPLKRKRLYYTSLLLPRPIEMLRSTGCQFTRLLDLWCITDYLV